MTTRLARQKKRKKMYTYAAGGIDGMHTASGSLSSVFAGFLVPIFSVHIC